MQLRTYQKTLIKSINESFTPHDRILLQLPTGGGKTVIFSNVLQRFVRAQRRVLILSHRTELVHQAAATVTALTGRPVGIIKSGIKPEPQHLTQSASVQTLKNRTGDYPGFDLIVIDEAHHTPAASYRKILGAYPDAKVLGVTATPCRTDGTGFEDLFDVLITGPSVRELIDLGFLSPFRYFASDTAMKTDGVRRTAGEYNAKELAEANPAADVATDVLNSYRQKLDGKRSLIFTIDVNHSLAVEHAFNQAGIPAAHLDGQTDAATRASVLAKFKSGVILALTNCSLFTEGTDVPEIEAVQIAKPTTSLSLHLQMIGRGMRVSPGKDEVIFIDHSGNYKLLGLPNCDRHWSLEEGLTKPKQQRFLKDSNGAVTAHDIPAFVPDLTRGVDLRRIDGAKARKAKRTIKPGSPADQPQRLMGQWKLIMAELKQREANGELSRKQVAYEVVDRAKVLYVPFKTLKATAAFAGYKPGWAYHRWCEQLLLEPNQDAAYVERVVASSQRRQNIKTLA